MHSKVTVAGDPSATPPTGTLSTCRPSAPGAESENLPTSPAETEAALASARPSSPSQAFVSRTEPSSSSRHDGRGSVTTASVHSDPLAPFEAVTV